MKVSLRVEDSYSTLATLDHHVLRSPDGDVCCPAAGLGSEPQQKPTKPVQSVAPQARDSSSSFSSTVGQPGTDSLVDLWDGGPAPPTNPTQTAAKSSNLVDLMDDVLHDDVAPSSAAAAAGGGKPQPLLSFDEMMDGTFCGGEDEPSSLVDMTASDQMTLSYQHALQHASGEELEDGQLLMTNGETLLKEGTQVRRAHSATVCTISCLTVNLNVPSIHSFSMPTYS